jgi:uncharacterized protein with HEPN domain
VTRTHEYLRDLLVEISLLESFTADGEGAFYEDERTQYAVMMAYARIGEIVKRLPDTLLATHPEVEWRDVYSETRYFDPLRRVPRQHP